MYVCQTYAAAMANLQAIAFIFISFHLLSVPSIMEKGHPVTTF
jgi:hypothetical protein